MTQEKIEDTKTRTKTRIDINKRPTLKQEKIANIIKSKDYDQLTAYLDELTLYHHHGNKVTKKQIIKYLNPRAGKSALYAAVQDADETAVSILLSCPLIDPNLGYCRLVESTLKFYSFISSPLWLAVTKNNPKIVDLLLLNKHINPNTGCTRTKSDLFKYPRITEITPLFAAITSSINPQILTSLLAHPHTNIFMGKIDRRLPTTMFSFFYREAPGVEEEALSPFAKSLIDGHIEIASLLLDKGAGLKDIREEPAIGEKQIYSAIKKGLTFDNKVVPGLRKCRFVRHKTNQSNPPITNSDELHSALNNPLHFNDEFDVQALLRACELLQDDKVIKLKAVLQHFLMPHEYEPIDDDVIARIEETTRANPLEKEKEVVADNLSDKEHIRLLQDRLDMMSAQMERLEKEFIPVKEKRERKKKITIQQEKIKSHEEKYIYYNTMLKQLHSLFSTIMVLQTHIIKPKLGELTSLSGKMSKPNHFLSEIEHGASLVNDTYEVLAEIGESSHVFINHSATDINKVLEALSPVTDAIPIVCSVTKIIQMITDPLVNVSDNWKLDNMDEIMIEMHKIGLGKIIEEIARQLTFSYMGQIKMLTPEGAKQFAEFGALRVLIILLNGIINSEGNIVDEIVKAVGMYSIKINHDKINFLKTEIDIPHLLYTVKIPVKNPLDQDVDQDLLYHSAGRYVRSNGINSFWSNDVKGKARPYPKKCPTEATRAGYIRLNTIDDIPKESMTEDEERRGPKSHFSIAN